MTDRLLNTTLLRIVVAGYVAVLVACQAPAGPPTHSTSALVNTAPGPMLPERTVSLMMALPQRNATSPIPFVAIAEGFFAQQGLDVTIVEMPPDIVPAAVVQGDVQATPIIGTTSRAALQGLPIKVLATFASRDHYILLADEKFQTVDDLRGQRIVTGPPASAVGVALLDILRHHGLDPTSDVRVLPVGQPAARNTLLLERQAEALVTGIDTVLQLQDRDPHLQRLTSPSILASKPTSGLAVSEAYLANAPDIVERLLRAHMQAARFIQQQPEQTQALLTRDFGLTTEQSQLIWEAIAPQLIPTGIPTEQMLETAVQLDGTALGRQLTLADARAVYDLRLAERLARELGIRRG